jgi:glycerate kinase
MKVVIAIDSFKGSLSSHEAAQAVEIGIKEAVGELAECTIIPVADGGEGTIDVLFQALAGKLLPVSVSDPLGRRIVAHYLLASDSQINSSKTGNLAVIEMARASGITLLTEAERNPLKTSSYGTGQLLLDALNRGCRKFFIGIGGSATNDAGMGILKALGVRFLDATGNELEGKGEDLVKINRIDTANLNRQLFDSNLEILVASDVDNPFYGEKGAAHIFAPQKCNPGIGEEVVKEIVEKLDRGLRNFAGKASEAFAIDEASISQIPGGGAAGGVGAALAAILNAKLVSGIEFVLNYLEAEAQIQAAAWVVTGEGQLDSQTVRGKVPAGVAALARKYNIPVIVFSGSIVDDPQELHDLGITAYFSILHQPLSLAAAMNKDNATAMLKQSSREVFRLIQCVPRTRH